MVGGPNFCRIERLKEIVQNTNKCELRFSYSQEKKKIVCTKMKSENLGRKKRGGGDNQS